MSKGKTKILVLTLIFSAMLCFNCSGVNEASAAQTFQKISDISGVVTAYKLNMRSGPTTEHEIVSVLEKGKWLNILAKIGDWYAVYDPDTEKIGCVSGKYFLTSSEYSEKSDGTTMQTITTPENTEQTKAPSTNLSADEQQLLDLINKQRTDAGLSPLKADAEVMKIARLKAKDMVENNYFSHNSPTYGSPFDMMRQYNVTFKTAGENIAGNRSIEGAVDAWMKSEGHKQNILNGKFNYTGIGIYESPKYGKVFVQMFIGK